MEEDYNKIEIDSSLDISESGRYYFEAEDNNIYIRLYSNELFNQHIINNKDREELKKLIKWLNTKERIEWIKSKAFKMDYLYLYIRLKAAQDKDFLKWWQEYDFDINIFLYNSGKWYKQGKNKGIRTN